MIDSTGFLNICIDFTFFVTFMAGISIVYNMTNTYFDTCNSNFKITVPVNLKDNSILLNFFLTLQNHEFDIIFWLLVSLTVFDVCAPSSNKVTILQNLLVQQYYPVPTPGAYDVSEV